MNFWEFPGGQWLGLGTFTAVEPGSALDQGTKILQAVHQPKKKRKESISEEKFLKICNLQSQSSYTFISLDFFIFLWFISSVSGCAICILLRII